MKISEIITKEEIRNIKEICEIFNSKKIYIDDMVCIISKDNKDEKKI